MNTLREIENQKAILIFEDENKIKFPIANNLKKIKLDKMKNPFGAFGVIKKKNFCKILI